MTNLARAKGLAEVSHETHAVVLNLPRIEEQQSPYVLDGTAFLIWNRIDGTTTEEQVIAELLGTSGTERALVAKDTREFLATLRSLGLIEGT